MNTDLTPEQLTQSQQPTKVLLVLNEMLPAINQALKDYSHNINREYKVEINKVAEQYSEVKLVNFNDNDLMLFGYFLYRTMMDTAKIVLNS